MKLSGECSDNPADQTPASNPSSNTKLDDVDIPIALRKGTRMCTKHPISKFLSYAHLSKSMQCLVTNLSNTVVPYTIQEALGNKEWSKAFLGFL